MMRRCKIVALLPVILFVCRLNAQTNAVKHAFDIRQCIEYSDKNNVQVKNALLAVKIQEQSNREITSAALPNLSGSLGLTDYLEIPTTLIPGQFFGGQPGTYEPVQFGTKYNSAATLQLQQVLFDGQVFVGLQARAASLEYQRKNVEVTQENIKANIYKIYYQLVVSKTQVSLLDANIERLQKLKHDETIMYKNGFAEKLDIDKVAVQLANLQTQKLKTLNTIEIGYLGLKTLLGMPVKDTLQLTDDISEEKIKNGLLDSGFQYTDRKEFQYLDVVKRLNEFNIKRYKLSYYPSVALTGVYSKSAQRTQFDIFGKGDWYTTSYLGVNISIPIFDGFAKDSRINQAKYTLLQTNNQISDLKLNIDNQVKQARLNFETAIATLDNQEENRKLAESVYNQTKKKYETGTGSNLEITNAQTDLITAETNYINSMYDAVIAKVDYYKAIGKL